MWDDDTVRLAGATLPRPRHICAFFQSKQEENDILLPFIKEGLERGEKILHIIDPETRSQHLQSLNAASIDVDERESSGQLEVCGWDQAYLHGGRFDQHGMLALMEEIFRDSRERGFPRTRVMGSLEWAAEDRPSLDAVIEYETRLNYLVPKYDDPVVCTYDCAKRGAGVAIDILRTHPMVIIGGILQENPFYVPPDEFLAELRGRAYSSACAS